LAEGELHGFANLDLRSAIGAADDRSRFKTKAGFRTPNAALFPEAEGRAIAAQLVRSGTSEQVQPLHQEAGEWTAIMAASRISAARSPIANRKSKI
jgi:hypothetical protein